MNPDEYLFEMLVTSKLREFYSPNNFWMKMVFLISGLSITLLLSISLSAIVSIIFLIPSTILGLIAWVYLIFHKNIINKIWKQTSNWIRWIAMLFACGTAWLFGGALYRDGKLIFQSLDKYIYSFFDSLSNYSFPETVQKYLPLLPKIYQYHDIIFVGFLIIICLLTLFVLYYIWKYLLATAIPIIREFIIGLDKIEKYYLCCMLILSIIAIPIIYNITSIFYYPTSTSGIFNEYSGIFGADTGNLIYTNAYGNINAPENDIRQLLFGLFALPFSIVAFIISKILFFIPCVYSIVLGIFQILSVAVIAVLIGRLLNTKSFSKILLLAIFTLSYPTLVFSILLEQYIFATFWLLLFIYSVCISGKFKEWFFIGACGTLSTSIITFPLLSKKFDIKKYLSVATIAVILAVVCGRFWKICYSIISLISLSGFTGTKLGVPIIDRVMQYLNFASLNFFTPSTVVIDGEKFMRYAQSPELYWNVLGIVVLCVVVLGFILNRKNLYAKICFGFVIFSFVILCLIGWNTVENALALQSFYFSWAFISLTYLAIYKIFIHHPKIQYLIFALLVISMICINIPGIYDIIQFGIQYYPVS